MPKEVVATRLCAEGVEVDTVTTSVYEQTRRVGVTPKDDGVLLFIGTAPKPDEFDIGLDRASILLTREQAEHLAGLLTRVGVSA